MKKETIVKDYRALLLSLVVLGLVAALIILPNQFRSEAGGQKQTGEGLVQKTESHEKGIENYDIREDKNEQAVNALISFREKSNTNAAAIADIRDNFAQGEEQLKASIPTLEVEYNQNIRIPEVIGTDVWKANVLRLTSPSGTKRSDVLRNFIKENNNLIGVSQLQADGLKATADYTNPDGNLSYAVLEQTINGIPVFRGEIKAGFTQNGEIFRVINNLAPGLDYSSLTTDFRDPLDAVNLAAKSINYELKAADVTRNSAASTDSKTVFGTGDWATTAEKMYFPTEPGVAVPAWRVLIWQPVRAYYVIIDAETGTMLWRKNLTSDQTQAATYNVYTNSGNMMNAANNPAPIVPGITNPGLGTQGAVIPRNNVTLIGNEGANSFNNNGWITDGTNGTNGETDGNAVEAGLDIDGANGVDPNGKAAGTNRVFNFDYNPAPGNPAPGDSPTLPGYRNGAVTQLFYLNNRYHDELYKLGFTEQARNFQNDNFGRGGVGGDRVSAEAQDSSGTNNANFSIAAEGTRGRMQMYIFSGPNPDYDGDLDGDIVVHEHTHGLSQRLVGNASGLGNNRGGSLGEGWSDFYGLALLSTPNTPANAIYTTGSWATYLFTPPYTFNYYYGIRRFPYAILSAVGGPNNRPHNPLTFADIDPAQINVSDGAFAGNPVFVPNGATEVHNAGEVWCVALWEVRAQLINRLGASVGNRKVLQLVTDGLKLTPNSPNFVQARDAIIAAAAASSVSPEAEADVIDVREGFRIRGMGFGAVDNSPGVVQSFDSPNVALTDPFSVDDSTGNGNGVPEPGESVLLNIAIKNTTGAAINNVVVNVNGGSVVSYGSIADGQTVTKQIPFTIPSNAECGSTVAVTINVSSEAGAQSPQTRSFILGSPVGTVENFDGVTAPALPASWTSTLTGAGTGWATSTTTPNSAPNAAFAGDPASVGLSTLETPALAVSSATARLKFKLNYNTEAGSSAAYDGMVLEMKIGTGAYQDILTAGGTFIANGYNRTLSTGSSNPLPGRQAWAGNSNGYKNVEVQLPAAVNGQNVQFRMIMGSDSLVGGGGVRVDDVELISSYNCGTVISTRKVRADFDGDRKTDLSVFRPSESNWYLNQSTAGFSARQWGVSSDQLVPGDYDGDGKTDLAVFRASAGYWYALLSQTNTVAYIAFGTSGDLAVPGDYDNDGKTDQAVFRSSNNYWYILKSSGGVTYAQFGASGDIPMAADWDGDGKTDLTVKRGNTWIAQLSGGGSVYVSFGTSGDQAVPADYDGDGKDDIAVYRGSTGYWYIMLSQTGTVEYVRFGTNGDVPVPGDYDGDGKADQAVYRGGMWYINGSQNGFSAASFGLGTDVAIPHSYLP